MPIVALVLATAGLLSGPMLGHVRFSGPGASRFALVFGFIACAWVQLLGPVAGPLEASGALRRLPAGLRRDAYLAATAAMAAAGLAGFALMAWLLLAGVPRHALMTLAVDLMLYMMSLLAAVPTLYVSWALPTGWTGGDLRGACLAR